MRVLITGGTGYIGSHTAIELLESGHEITIIDNLSNSKVEVLDKIEQITSTKPNFVQADIRDKSALKQIFTSDKYDAVIHFAGLKAVGESVQKPLEYYENNITGTLNLLEAMRESGVNKIIFSSSATVYGDPETLPLTENSRVGVGITNPYGWTKYMIEQILKDWCVSDATAEVTILRYFNPIGAHASGLIGEDPNGLPNNLTPYIAKVATGELPFINVYGNDYDTPDGTGVRDYIHVVDLAKGHIAALNHMKSGAQIYNLGTGQGSSVMELIHAFEATIGRELEYKVVARRPGDVATLYASTEKALSDLGWKAEKTIADACADTWKYLQTTNA